MPRIKCGHCRNYHPNSEGVFLCPQGPRARANARAASVVAAPPVWPYVVPQVLVDGIRQGRYAVSPGDGIAPMFIWLDRPTTGKHKGSLIVKTQHGDNYIKRLEVFESGNIWHDSRIQIKAHLDEALMLVAVDEVGCAIRYGEIIGKCSRCGKKLTDSRSRWFTIGPDCEQLWPDLIEEVIERKGHFIPGVGL